MRNNTPASVTIGETAEAFRDKSAEITVQMLKCIKSGGEEHLMCDGDIKDESHTASFQFS